MGKPQVPRCGLKRKERRELKFNPTKPIKTIEQSSTSTQRVHFNLTGLHMHHLFSKTASVCIGLYSQILKTEYLRACFSLSFQRIKWRR